MKRLATRYQPKGGMCMSCRKRLGDCSDLPFSKMPVLHEGESTVIVRCTEYVRKEAKV